MLKKKDTIELSKADHGKLMATALTESMVANPDEIVRNRGGGKLKVYKELMRDDQVKSTLQQRRTATTKTEWYVQPGSEDQRDIEIAEFVNEQIKQLKFDQLTDKMLYALHYGYSIGEIMWAYDEQQGKIVIDTIKVRDRDRFSFSENNNLILHRGLDQDIMPEDKFWCVTFGADHDDNPYGEGLAHSLYWPVFFKRNGVKFWLIYLEKYGMPTAAAKLTHGQFQDPQQRQIARQIINTIQTDSGVVVPDDFTLELIEATRSGHADYNAIKTAMDEAISKVVLSQTMTTDNGSSQSQATVHNEVKQDLIKSDADLICESFNAQVITRLVDHNYPDVQNYPQVWRRTEPQQDLLQLAERDNKIMQLGYEPTEDYVQDTYGAGWRKKTDPLPPSGNNVPPIGAEFAEVTDLTNKRIDHRKDQQQLIDAAEVLSTEYNELYGKRIEQVKAILDSETDPETAKQRITALMAEPVDEQVTEYIEKASFFSRLMGLFSKQASR